MALPDGESSGRRSFQNRLVTAFYLQSSSPYSHLAEVPDSFSQAPQIVDFLVSKATVFDGWETRTRKKNIIGELHRVKAAARISLAAE